MARKGEREDGFKELKVVFTGSEGTRLTARKSRLILKCGGAVATGMKAMIAGEATGEAKVGLKSCRNPIGRELRTVCEEPAAYPPAREAGRGGF